MRSFSGMLLTCALTVGLGTLLLSCGSKETGDSDKCTDVRCYGICLGNAWADMDESYWIFEAFCTEDNMCNCLNYCDNDRCDNFCKEEGFGTAGSCDFLSCVCTGPSSDAGPGDAGGDDTDDVLDAGNDVSDAGDDSSSCTDSQCYDVCLEGAWSDKIESYWVFEASCSDDNMCNCVNYCDNDLCDLFCQDEGLGSSGACDFLDCVCSDAVSDAG